jgi:hypothetical protein
MYGFAGLADITYYPAPASVIEKIDMRMESLARPVTRIKGSFIFAVGDKVHVEKLVWNAILRRTTIIVPTLTGGKTITVTIQDEAGATVYTSGALTGTTFSSSDLNVPLAGINTLNVTMSDVQAVERAIYVFLYGE